MKQFHVFLHDDLLAVVGYHHISLFVKIIIAEMYRKSEETQNCDNDQQTKQGSEHHNTQSMVCALTSRVI